MAKTAKPPDFQAKGEAESQSPALDLVASAIQRANEELESAASSKFELPVTVLIKQRDDALSASAGASAQLDAELKKLRAEHDELAESLISEHQAKVHDLKQEHAAALNELRKTLVHSPTTGATSPGMGAVTESNAASLILREQLADALSNLETARREATLLQEELQAAVVSYDDMRHEMWNSTQEARDEAAALRLQCQELTARLEDERAISAEQVKELRKEKDRLRHELDEALSQSAVPPAANKSNKTTKPDNKPRPTEPALKAARADEERAKEEAHALRMELINAKRDLNQRSQELHAVKDELRRSRRPAQQLVTTTAELDARVAKLSEAPAFQRFLKRRERTLGTYSDGGSVDVVDRRAESSPPSSAARKTDPDRR